MKRGEIWTVAGGPEYAGKPRPAVVLQDDSFDALQSVTLCMLTTNSADALLYRLSVEPDEANGLRQLSRLMVDKITTLPKSKLGEHVGRLADEDMVRLNRAVLVFLGLAGSPRKRNP